MRANDRYVTQVKNGDIRNIKSWINEGDFTFYVQHGERYGKHIRWAWLERVKLQVVGDKALTYEGFGGHPYTHFEGKGIWARREGSEHVMKLFVPQQ